MNRVSELFRSGSVLGLELYSGHTHQRCESCIVFKLLASPVESKDMRVRQSSDIIHADVEYMGHRSFAGAELSLKFLDEYSNYLWVFAINNKEGSTVLSH